MSGAGSLPLYIVQASQSEAERHWIEGRDTDEPCQICAAVPWHGCHSDIPLTTPENQPTIAARTHRAIVLQKIIPYWPLSLLKAKQQNVQVFCG